jgi:hypothetical protein
MHYQLDFNLYFTVFLKCHDSCGKKVLYYVRNKYKQAGINKEKYFIIYSVKHYCDISIRQRKSKDFQVQIKLFNKHIYTA